MLTRFVKGRRAYLVIFAMLFIAGSCTLRKGNAYRYNAEADTTTYIIRNKGSGSRIARKIEKLSYLHHARGDDYKIVYLGDSLSVVNNRSILLFRTEQPDFKEDFLNKGFIGAIGTKRVVSYLLVTREDFNKYFLYLNK